MKYRITFPSRAGGGARGWGEVLLWLLGGGALVLTVFGLTFYMAMKVEMRSTEVMVPELTGLSMEEANAKASPLGLVLQVADRRHDPRVASGRVLQQQPAGGSRVREGRKLKLVLSLGGRVLTVPDLVGEADRAVEIRLRQDGFAPGDHARVGSRDAPSGSILAQVPPPGSPGVPNTRVHRLVSSGPPDLAWVMPDLIGRPRDQVERWLEATRFRRGPVRTIRAPGEPPGTVVGQLPLAGYPIRRNDIVELTVAR